MTDRVWHLIFKNHFEIWMNNRLNDENEEKFICLNRVWASFESPIQNRNHDGSFHLEADSDEEQLADYS